MIAATFLLLMEEVGRALWLGRYPGMHDLQEMCSLSDWYLNFWLQKNATNWDFKHEKETHEARWWLIDQENHPWLEVEMAAMAAGLYNSLAEKACKMQQGSTT